MKCQYGKYSASRSHGRRRPQSGSVERLSQRDSFRGHSTAARFASVARSIRLPLTLNSSPAMSLTASASLKIGPLMLVTAVNHFLDRHKDPETRSKARDEILFDEGLLYSSTSAHKRVTSALERLLIGKHALICAPYTTCSLFTARFTFSLHHS